MFFRNTLEFHKFDQKILTATSNEFSSPNLKYVRSNCHFRSILTAKLIEIKIIGSVFLTSLSVKIYYIILTLLSFNYRFLYCFVPDWNMFFNNCWAWHHGPLWFFRPNSIWTVSKHGMKMVYQPWHHESFVILSSQKLLSYEAPILLTNHYEGPMEERRKSFVVLSSQKLLWYEAPILLTNHWATPGRATQNMSATHSSSSTSLIKSCLKFFRHNSV